MGLLTGTFPTVGDAFSVSYMAALDAGDLLGDGDHLELAALLIFPSSAQVLPPTCLPRDTCC